MLSRYERSISMPAGIHLIKLSLAFLGFIICVLANNTFAAPPNIVLIIGDDLSFHDLGCWGNEDVHTPNIDRLATQGLRLTRCFAPASVCSPLRQALYTGLHPVKSGAYPNHSFVKPGTKSLPHYLAPLGYRVGLVGKAHFNPPECYPFEFPGRKIANTNTPASSVENQTSEQIGSLDIGDIERFINHDKTQPYCLVAASNEPHSPWNKGDATRFDPAKFKLPPYFVDTPETRTALANYYAEVAVLDDQVGRILELIEQSGRSSNTLVLFISEQGSSMPHGKWTLYEPGIRGALIARWPGQIKAGSSNDALSSYVDVLPTLIEIAGGKPVAGLAGRTMLDVFKGKANRHSDVIFAEETSRGIVNGPKAYGIRCVRDERYKLIWNLNFDAQFSNETTAPKHVAFNSWRRAAETNSFAQSQVDRYLRRPELELYDLDSDPWEMNNIAAAAEHRSRIQRLRGRLEAWMKDQGDRGVETELEANQHQGRGKKAAMAGEGD